MGSLDAGPRWSGSVGWGSNKLAASQFACDYHQGLRDFWSELLNCLIKFNHATLDDSQPAAQYWAQTKSASPHLSLPMICGPSWFFLPQLVGSTEKREEPQLSIAGGLSQSSHSVWPEVIYFGGVTLNMITARLQKILQTATFQNWRKKL